MGLMLAWLIRHDLHDPEMWPEEHVRALKAGEMTGSDLADDCDGKLVSDMFTPEGAAFLDRRYDAYLAAWEGLFVDWPAYGVRDDAQARATVEPLIDRLHADWVAGVPSAPVVAAASPGPAPGAAKTEPVRPSQTATSAPAPAPITLVPPGLTDPPMEIESVDAAAWGASLLRRALLRLNVRATDATVVAGLGGAGDHTLTMTIYGVPGIPAEALLEEFASVIYKPGRAPWRERQADGRTVRWADATDDAPFSVAWWTRDGLVFHLAGDETDVLTAVARFD
jgi:hypothetical protein